MELFSLHSHFPSHVFLQMGEMATFPDFAIELHTHTLINVKETFAIAMYVYWSLQPVHPSDTLQVISSSFLWRFYCIVSQLMSTYDVTEQDTMRDR